MLDLLTPPEYCHYAGGPCNQDLKRPEGVNPTVFFAYPASPEPIAATIEAAAKKLSDSRPEYSWRTWKELPIHGQTIFCEICKSMRWSATVVADVTTLSFNLLFEIGYTIGLGLPIIPIRDVNFQADKRAFEELGLLDTLGYLDFTNSNNLRDQLASRIPAAPLPSVATHEYRQSPLYVLKGPVETEGAVQMMSAIKKSGAKFRAYDPIETPRLSLHEALRQVSGSTGVIANLLAPQRAKSLAHNAQCALVCGVALARQIAVTMIQENQVPQPIDYRDIVQPYTNPNNIPGLLQPTLRRTLEALQAPTPLSRRQRDLLQVLDLGDVAAENEISGLREYFVVTGQATQAKQGHARLVVGRKGSGKTAVFYDVRNWIGRGLDRLILDLKPEGHQFTKLRELVLDGLVTGLQEHTMVAFWNYILLGELARKALEQDERIAYRDPQRYEPYKRLRDVYLQHDPGGDYDFSQRLLMQVDRISHKLGDASIDDIGSRITEVLYSGGVRELGVAVSEYLRTKSTVWLLVDNLDKGWPVRGTSSTDILIVRSLLDATRKLQHQMEDHDVEFDCLVFLRSDIYEHLRAETPDKGKDTAIRLDWEDPALFEEIVRRRIEVSTDLAGPFREMWLRICTPLVDGQDSFNFVLDRTLMRPRDLLLFLRTAVHTAINRGHERIDEGDFRQAERSYSEDMLLTTSFEIADTYPQHGELLYAFDGAPPRLARHEAVDKLVAVAGIESEEVDQVLELLLWFGFFGVLAEGALREKYSHDVQGNVRRLNYLLGMDGALLVIHPAFRAALDIGTKDAAR